MGVRLRVNFMKYQMKKLILVSWIMWSGVVLKAQLSDSTFWKNMALETANDLELTFKERNYKRYAELNHPKLVAMFGTVDDFAKMMEQQMATIEKEVKIDSIDFGVPFNFVKCDSSINCLLSQSMIMRLGDSIGMRSTVYLLGVSDDVGKTWYFVDASNGAAFLDLIAPRRCKDFIIPDKKQEFIKK